MKLSITLSALLVAGLVTASVEPASAVVYCQYVDYPAGCSVRAGVVLRPRPVARAVATPGVGAVGTPMNRGGSGGSCRPALMGVGELSGGGSLDAEALKYSGHFPETEPCPSSS